MSVAHNDRNPIDVLEDAKRLVGLLTVLFIGNDPPEFGKDDCGGVCLVLERVKRHLVDAEAIVQEQIVDPYTAGYREASAAIKGEYARGYRTGREAAVRSADAIDSPAAGPPDGDAADGGR